MVTELAIWVELSRFGPCDHGLAVSPDNITSLNHERSGWENEVDHDDIWTMTASQNIVESMYLHSFCVFPLCYCLVVSLSAIDCLERHVSKNTYYVLSGIVNHTHSLALLHTIHMYYQPMHRNNTGCEMLLIWMPFTSFCTFSQKITLMLHTITSTHMNRFW